MNEKEKEELFDYFEKKSMILVCISNNSKFIKLIFPFQIFDKLEFHFEIKLLIFFWLLNHPINLFVLKQKKSIWNFSNDKVKMWNKFKHANYILLQFI